MELRLPSRRLLLVGLCLAVLSVWSVFHFYHKKYPFGDKGPRVLVMGAMMHMYAHDNNGWFPDNNGGVDSLRLLWPQFDHNALAGISGDEDETKRRLESGIPLDGRCSSWVYVSGLRADDYYQIAVLWDRLPGIAWNGEVMKDTNCHFVCLANGSMQGIPGDQWKEFLTKQEQLIKELQKRRANVGIK